MEVELLEKIAKNTEHKTSFQIIVSGNETSYEIDDINNTVQQEMKKRGHYDSINEDYPINISANSNTLKSVLILEKDYQVDFNHRGSLAKVLGFTGTKHTSGFH